MGAGCLNHCAPIHRHKVNSAEWTRLAFCLWLSFPSPILQYSADVIYTEPHNLPHHLQRPFPWQYNKMFWRLCGIQPGFQRCEFSEISTMLPALNEISIKQFIYCHHHSPGLQPHLSTRWTGQMPLTDSQGVIHESWMARCSSRAPGFSSEQYA